MPFIIMKNAWLAKIIMLLNNSRKCYFDFLAIYHNTIISLSEEMKINIKIKKTNKSNNHEK